MVNPVMDFSSSLTSLYAPGLTLVIQLTLQNSMSQRHDRRPGHC